MSVEDEHYIHKIVARYADAVIRRDRDDWAATWSKDAKWFLPGASAEGKDNIVALWVGAMKRFPFVVQLPQHGVVEVSGATAKGTFYINEHMTMSDGGGASSVGCYQDRFVKDTAQTNRDGGWLFSERRYTVLYHEQGAGQMSGMTAPVPPRVD